MLVSSHLIGFGAGGAAKPTTPPIAGYTAWFRADTVTLSGSNVSQWDDKSGNGRHLAQGTAANQPLIITASSLFDNEACVDFDGSNDRVDSSAALSTFITNSAGTVIICAHVDAYTANNANFYNNDNIVRLGNGEAGLYGKNTGGGQILASNFDSNEDTNVLSLSAGTTAILTWKHESGNVIGRLNKAAEVSTASGNTSTMTAAISVGATTAGGGPFNGKIAEILFYNTALSTSDCSLVIDYLAARYGVSV